MHKAEQDWASAVSQQAWSKPLVMMPAERESGTSFEPMGVGESEDAPPWSHSQCWNCLGRKTRSKKTQARYSKLKPN